MAESVSLHLLLSSSSRCRKILAVAIAFLFIASISPAQTTKKSKANRTQASHLRVSMSPEERDVIDRATDVICVERKKDPQGSIPIDDMQGRPSLPVASPEAIAGADRAQRLLPVARDLTIRSLQQLANRYYSKRPAGYQRKLQLAIVRVQNVTKVTADMDSRDNASVYLRTPHTINFGTIFLAGLPSDEGMVSVLAHELTHIADGDRDSLGWLFRAIGDRASKLTALRVKAQRAEELTCDLVGAMAARGLVADSPSYEPVQRRLARSIEHNCVEQDEGDEDHLSPRNTIRAVLALEPDLARALAYGDR